GPFALEYGNNALNLVHGKPPSKILRQAEPCRQHTRLIHTGSIAARKIPTCRPIRRELRAVASKVRRSPSSTLPWTPAWHPCRHWPFATVPIDARDFSPVPSRFQSVDCWPAALKHPAPPER